VANGRYRDKSFEYYFIYFIGSDDKINSGRPSSIPPKFWKTLEKQCTLFGLKASAESMHMPKRYVNVKLPVELGDEVDKILEKILGYRSRAEFVAEAVRDKLLQVKK
jgi:hypothetical protein